MSKFRRVYFVCDCNDWCRLHVYMSTVLVGLILQCASAAVRFEPMCLWHVHQFDEHKLQVFMHCWLYWTTLFCDNWQLQEQSMCERKLYELCEPMVLPVSIWLSRLEVWREHKRVCTTADTVLQQWHVCWPNRRLYMSVSDTVCWYLLWEKSGFLRQFALSKQWRVCKYAELVSLHVQAGLDGCRLSNKYKWMSFATVCGQYSIINHLSKKQLENSLCFFFYL